MNVAFVLSALTRNLYKGLVEVTPLKASGLPDEDDSVEAAMTVSKIYYLLCILY